MHRVTLGVVLLVAFGLPAVASTVLRFGVKDLTTRSAVIIHGKVTSKTARDVGRGVIVTDYKIEVYEAVKGVKGKTFLFTAYGGILEKRGSAISGAPKYSVNEEVFLFLSKSNKKGWRQAIGLAQGKYTIRAVKGKKMAFRDLEGLRLMDRQSGAVEAAKKESGVAFDQLLKDVKTTVKAQTKKAETPKRGG